MQKFQFDISTNFMTDSENKFGWFLEPLTAAMGTVEHIFFRREIVIHLSGNARSKVVERINIYL